MSKQISLSLDDQSARFVEDQVAEGRYGSAGEVVQAGLQLLKDQETKLATLRAALVEGEESGPPTPFDFHVFIRGMRGARPGVQ